MAENGGNQKRWDIVLDGEGNIVKGFRRYTPTNMIYVRQGFPELGLPDLFKSTGESEIHKAKQRIKVLTQDHLKRHTGVTAAKGKSFGEVCDEILSTGMPNKRQNTREMYRMYLPQLKEEFGNYSVHSITPALFDAFIAKRRDESSRKTFRDYAKFMGIIMRWAYQNQYVSHLLKFKNPDAGKVHPSRVYSDDELLRLWGAMSEETKDQFVLAVECFMRLREALKLTWDRVDLGTGKVVLRSEDAKTAKAREIILSSTALGRLRERYKHRGTSIYIFPARHRDDRPIGNNKTAWKLTKKRAGITGRATWHSLRHTALTRALLEKKMNPVLVSEYAGVSLPTLQRVYLHANAEHTKEVAGTISLVAISGTTKT